MLLAATKDRSGPEPRRESRTHSHKPIGDTPKTPGERMTYLRKQLGLRQEDVATEIRFVRKDGNASTMSRSAYCMYEADAVTLDIDRVALIAKVLHTTPEYIAYGVTDDNSVAEVALTPEGFTPVRNWTLSEDWLYERYDAEASHLRLLQTKSSSSSNTFSAGDMVVVNTEKKPGTIPAEYVFSEDGRLKIETVVKPSRTSGYIVIHGKSQRTLVEAHTTFLGKVIGRFGGL